MKAYIWILPAILVASACARHDERRSDIVFAPKAYFDSAQTTGDAFVYVAGTLTGEGVPYRDNTNAIACYKERMECLTYGVSQIGPNQVSRLDAPVVYQVTRWDPDEIVASGPADSVDCRKTTISIVRRTERVVWVEEPINAASAACVDAETRLFKWTLEESPTWKR